MENSKIKVGMVSLGCPKNQCDAEIMLSKIQKAGFKLVGEAGLADVVVINTCGFIKSAKEEAIEEIFEAISRKNDGINKKIIVTGCLAERYTDQMENEFPEVDAVLTLGANGDIVAAIGEVMGGNRKIYRAGIGKHELGGDRMITTLPHYAYLRIAEGCDNCCSYCAIPLIRGKFRSRPIDDLITEAENLAKRGVKELVIVAQDTTRYGLDLYGKLALPELLRELCKIDEIRWIRLMYCYPERVTDELVEVMKKEEKIVNYMDLPIQHCNGDILRMMNRQGNERTLWDLIAKLRNNLPGLVLRTTLITGFPGETEEQFIELAEFVNEIKFERLGCFPYSEEDDTPAAEYEDQVNEAERKHRSEIILEQQEVRMNEYYNDFIGETMEVVVEGYDRFFEMYFGRSYMYAPEVDGMVYFKGQNLDLSDFVLIKITDVVDNNLIGEATGE